MDQSGIKDIIELMKESLVVEHGDEKYSRMQLYRVGQEDHVAKLHISTLSSLAEIIKNNPQGFDLEGAVVVIDEDFNVSLLSKPGDRKAREIYVEAKNPVQKFEFGKRYDSVSFCIAIQTLFVGNNEATELFKRVSTIKIDEGVEITDDGKSTKFTAKMGVSEASVAVVSQKSIVKLKPFRTFAECDQVESPFLFRLSGSKEEGAFVTLFECDGGAWKVQAFKTIADKLVQLGVKLPIYY
jgi:hypothetical protein